MLQQVLDHYAAILLLVDGPSEEPAANARGLLGTLDVAELQAVAAALAILTAAARRRADAPDPGPSHPGA